MNAQKQHCVLPGFFVATHLLIFNFHIIKELAFTGKLACIS